MRKFNTKVKNEKDKRIYSRKFEIGNKNERDGI